MTNNTIYTVARSGNTRPIQSLLIQGKNKGTAFYFMNQIIISTTAVYVG